MEETIDEGAGIKFVCISTTIPIWFFNDEILPINAITSSEKPHEYHLTITNATLFNEGFYECKGTMGTNDKQTMRARGGLTVNRMFYVTLLTIIYFV